MKLSWALTSWNTADGGEQSLKEAHFIYVLIPDSFESLKQLNINAVLIQYDRSHKDHYVPSF